MADTMRPDRIVAGVASERAEALLREVYARPLAAGVPFLVTDLPTAELVKVAANAFLATKVSFINAMAEVCEAAGADIVPLAEALAHDNRIGGRFLVPGLGFGGGCLPKDIRAFAAAARELGVDSVSSWLGEVDAINLRRRARMVDLALEMAGGADGCTVGVLGCSFKPQSDDIRDSPALDVAGTCTASAPGSRSTTRRPWTGPGRSIPSWSTPARCWTPRPGPTCCCCSPSGASSSTPTPTCSAGPWPSATSPTGAAPSTPAAGGPRAGATARSAARPDREGRRRRSARGGTRNR